jgi:hypothetical protein
MQRRNERVVFFLTELVLFTCPILNLSHEHVTALFWDVTSSASVYVVHVHVGMLVCNYLQAYFVRPRYLSVSSALPMGAHKLRP